VGENINRYNIPHPKSSHGKQFNLTVADHFTKWAEAIPLINHTASSVAKALVTQVFSKFGVPRQTLSDRGPEFESELFTQLLKWLEIDKLRSSPYEPSTNGMVERFHRTLNSMLGKVVKESQQDWDEKLPLILAAYRASPHSSAGYTLNKLFLRHEDRMPLDLVMGLPEGEMNGGQNIDEFVQIMKDKAEMLRNRS